MICSFGCSLPAHADYFTCTPIGAGEFTNRVHIHCSNAQSGITYFAVQANDADRAARILGLVAGAVLAGHTIDILYDPNDLSGGVWGCNNVDCRIAQGAELH